MTQRHARPGTLRIGIAGAMVLFVACTVTSTQSPSAPSDPSYPAATTDPAPAPTFESPPSPGASATSAPPAASSGAESRPDAGPPQIRCKLPAPVKSNDVCKTDADCGVSEPCHAKACVATAKSHPPTKDTACTMILACDSADANRCGCFENRCALIP